jgi:pimeloyl-ACP methyl ester carboxylesterase
VQCCRPFAETLLRHNDEARPQSSLSFAQDADDVAARLRAIGVPQADVLGFSNRADDALELERRHPEVVRRLMVAAGFVTRDGIPAPVWAAFRQPPDTANMPPLLRAAYRDAAPDLHAAWALASLGPRRFPLG